MRFGLVVNSAKSAVYECLPLLGEIASKHGCLLLLREKDNKFGASGLRGIQICSETAFYEQTELFLAVGGDGTIIEAARMGVKRSLPVAGINLGRVGFLSCIEKKEMDRFSELCKGEYRIEKRLVLQVEADGRTLGTAINEFCFQRDSLAKTPEFSVVADGCNLGDFRADGLLFSTPTGSTAYSLAAGGPILSPDVPAFLMTPLCPIGEKRQSVVFSAQSVIGLVPRVRAGNKLHLLADGHPIPLPETGGFFTLKAASAPLSLVKLPEDRFLNNCVQKIWKEKRQ